MSVSNAIENRLRQLITDHDNVRVIINLNPLGFGLHRRVGQVYADGITVMNCADQSSWTLLATATRQLESEGKLVSEITVNGASSYRKPFAGDAESG